MKKYVIGKAFEEHTPETFHAYVTGLYKAPETLPDSKSASNIRLAFNKKGTMTIRCKRELKEVTEAEVAALALEYKIEKEQLTEGLTKRKFVIKNAEGEQTNVKPRTNRRARKAKPVQEADAHLRDVANRPIGGENQLFQSGPNTDMQSQSLLQLGEGLT